LKPFTIQGWCWISLMDALCCESRISILEIKCVHSVTDQLKCQHCIVKQSNSVTYLATAMMDTQHDILKFFLAELTCPVRQMVLVHKLRCIVQFQDTRHRLQVRYTAGLNHLWSRIEMTAALGAEICEGGRVHCAAAEVNQLNIAISGDQNILGR